MFSLFRKEITFVILFLSSAVAEAQVKTKHQPDYDAKTVRFGYFIGFASTHYTVRHAPTFTSAANTVLSLNSPNSIAIRAGAMINYHLNDYFDFRFSPLNIAIQNRTIAYVPDTGTGPGEEKEAFQDSKSWLEVPFHIKYKSERRGNSRMYIFAGGRWAFETNITTKKANKVNKNLTMRTNDFMLEYGVGLEFFREYFKMTPELHFSHGMFNMIRKDNSLQYLDHVNSLKTHSVSLLILFQ